MAKARSPGYPTIGLREAIEKIQLVYAKDYQNKIPRALVAEHMGYRSMNGKSLGVLSAIGKYGLLDGRADSNWVSDLALAIIAHEPGTPERARAIAEAAGRPELFADLDAKFQGGRFSDGAVRSYLMTQKFIPHAADAVIRSYRETKELVNEEGAGYNGSSQSETEPESPPMSSPQAAESQFRPTQIGGAPASAPLTGERELLRGPLSRDSNYRLLVSGEIGAKELGKIIKLLTVYKELYLDDDEKLETSSDN